MITEQTNPLYRSYVEHEWVRLGPGESKTVRIMVEYAGEDYLKDGGDPTTLEKFFYIPNELVVSGLARPSQGGCFAYPTGGASLKVDQGLEIAFKTLEARDAGGEHLLTGELYVKGTGAPAPNGQVLITLDPGTKPVTLGPVPTTNGSFQYPSPAGTWNEAEVYYIAPQGYGDVSALVAAP